MEIEEENTSIVLSRMTTEELCRLLPESYNSFENRYTEISTEKEKNLAMMCLISLRSRIYIFGNKILGKEINPKKCTPDRSNMLYIGNLLIPQNQDEEVNQDFLRRFYGACQCRKKCNLNCEL